MHRETVGYRPQGCKELDMTKETQYACMCHSARYFTNITLSSQTHTKMSASIVILKKSKRVQKQDLLLECCTLRWGSWDVNPVLCSSIKMSSKEVSIVGPGFQLDPFLSNSKAPKCVCVHAFEVSEKSIRILYMSHLQTKYGVAQFIQEMVSAMGRSGSVS